MKIAVICANGRAGRLIVKEAVSRELEVTAVVREENQTVAQQVLKKDLFDLAAADLTDFDVVIDAFGAWTEDTLFQHSTSLKHLCDILSESNVRLLVVGGAGKALSELRQRNDVKWTFISPAGDFRADGERTGKYILGGEELILNSKGESVISYSDYAIAMIDEAMSGDHVRQRISVVAE